MAIEIDGIPVPEGTDTISAEALQAMVTAQTGQLNTHLADYADFKSLQMFNINYQGDCNDLPNGSVIRILSSLPPNAHRVESFIWTMRSGSHGVQVSFLYTGNEIAYRRLANNIWYPWVVLQLK